MNQDLQQLNQSIYGFCKEKGCCERCILRYIGLKNPNTYENAEKYVKKYQGEHSSSNTSDKEREGKESAEAIVKTQQNGDPGVEESDSPPIKKFKSNICVTCLGILQEDSWPECLRMVNEILDRKRYECATFACALSAPIVTLLREKVLTLMLQERYPDYDPNVLCPLKEAWKWSFGNFLESHIDKVLDSGAVSPLLVTLSMEYSNEFQELEILKRVAPALFESRSQQKRRFAVEFTRRCVEQALEGIKTTELAAAVGAGVEVLGVVSGRASCVSVQATHTPMYLAGRYIKLCRDLPQTPWVVRGQRVMESSVQEILFEPIAKFCGMEESEAEHRLKLVAAGREDVDVRCLGDGRPFAVEIADPRRRLSRDELRAVCNAVNAGGRLLVKELVHIAREDLVLLKTGEQNKTKSYEALCIKLDGPVTAEDLERVNTYSNCSQEDSKGRVQLIQRTPLRVLHRRPLLSRTRHLLELSAEPVSGHDKLFVVRVRTEAGTYVKEWVHGELGRTKPSLGDAMASPVDILALDVAAVHLAWPPTQDTNT